MKGRVRIYCHGVSTLSGNAIPPVIVRSQLVERYLGRVDSCRT